MKEHVEIVHLEELALRPVRRGDAYGYDRAILVEGDGTDRCCVQVYHLPPGKANYPYHAHETHEEVFYIISGNGVAMTPQGERPLRAGDVMLCPPGPGGAHKIINTGEDVMVYLEVDAIAFPEVATYPLSGGMAVLYGDRDRNMFFIDGKRVDYDEICEGG